MQHMAMYTRDIRAHGHMYRRPCTRDTQAHSRTRAEPQAHMGHAEHQPDLQCTPLATGREEKEGHHCVASPGPAPGPMLPPGAGLPQLSTTPSA